MIRIVTDSSSDILQLEAKQFNIKVIPLTITFEDGTSYLDEIELSREDFYKKLQTSKKPPTTAQIPLHAYEEIYTEAKAAGDIVLMMPISSKLSGSFFNAHMIKNQGNFDNVYIFDTLATVHFLKMLVVQAVKMRDKNMPIEKILDELEKLRQKITLYGVIDTLEYLRKGGRIHRASAIIGGLLHIKPIIGIVDGELPMLSKHIGIAKAIVWVKDKIKKHPIDFNYPVYYQYTGTPERINQLIDAIDKNPEKAKTETGLVGAVVGTHIGPGAFAICYVKKE